MNGIENENKARARYLKRGIYSNPDNSRKIYLNDLAHKLIPSLGYYILLIIAGITCGLAFLYHSKALLVLTLAILPFMGPFFGISLSAVTGSFSFLGKSFLKFLIGIGLFFLSSLGVGGFGRQPVGNISGSTPVALFADDFVFFTDPAGLMILTVIICSYAAAVVIVKGSEHPQALSSGIMAGVLLPIGLAGFCIGLHYFDPLWDCIRTSIIYGLIGLAASLLAFLFTQVFVPQFKTFLLSGILLVGATLYLCDFTNMINLNLDARFSPMRGRFNALVNPPTVTPTLIPSATSTATITQTASFTPTGTITKQPTATLSVTFTKSITPTQPTVTPSATITFTAVPPTPTKTYTVTYTPTVTPTKVMTPTRTIRPSKTPTITFTPSATIVYGIVSVSNDVGLLIRAHPGLDSEYVKSQFNGSMLEILGEQKEQDGILWVKVRTNDGSEGWASAAALRTATPLATRAKP